MPFFTLDQVRQSLDYMAEHTHPTLMSVLAMLRHKVPMSDDPDDAVSFGSKTERLLMEDYFQPRGGPEDRPYFVPFGTGRGYTHWRDRNYAGKSLQRQRGDRDDLFKQHPSDNKRWTFAKDLSGRIKNAAAEVVGNIPIEVCHLAVWCYRDQEFSSLDDANARFVDEFQLSKYELLPEIFTDEIASQLSSVPLVNNRIDDGELLLLLQAMEPEKKISTEESGGVTDAVTAVGKVHLSVESPGDWNMGLADLGDLCGLRGMEEPATRALAALSAGVNVIFTGPPGTGKTKLAECVCAKAGFPAWTVPATDQWTTFETIGGYFPTPSETESGDRLDFLPGAVVDSILKNKCLIIDEINRADIDKAFGELFTLLSGNTVTLPYRRRSEAGKFKRIRLQVGSAVVEDEDTDVIVVPAWWRIVGSMNDADKASLKRLSMAFVRRFAFIPIDLPDPDIYESIIKSAVESTTAIKDGIGAMPELFSILVDLFTKKDSGLSNIGLPLGPSFPQSIIRHADSEWRIDASRPLETVLSSALELYVMPQFQGRPDLHEAASDLFQPMLNARHVDFERHLAVWTGFIPG